MREPTPTHPAVNRYLILCSFFLLSLTANAQIVGSDAFMQGEFVEIGVNEC